VAEWRVLSEPVSVVRFPVMQRKYREFHHTGIERQLYYR
jgi:hypothetical protein